MLKLPSDLSLAARDALFEGAQPLAISPSNSRISPDSSLLSSASAAGKLRLSPATPTGTTTPRSRNRPRSWLHRAVRLLTNWARTRCNASRSCCATLLTVTNRVLGRVTASRIASASLRSVLLPLR
jgi:hypothetical protein